MYKRIALSLCGLLLSLTALAQEDKAVLTGTITDPSTATVPEATVEVSGPINGFSRRVTTNNAGSYYIASLPIGTYTVTISKAGFQSAHIEAVQLLVGQIRTLNHQMQI